LSARTLLFIAGVYFSVLTVVEFWLWERSGGSFATRAVDDISSLSGILFAALCSAWAARSARGRVRHGWRAMTAGLLGWAIGEVIWSYYELVLGYEQSPYPSLADAFYLMYPVGAGVAVVLLSTSKTGRSRIRLVLDGLIVAASLFVVSWISVIENVFRAGGESHLALAVSLAYPVADVVIIIIAWASAVVAYRPSMGLLVAGLIIVALSDSVFSGLAAVNDYYTGNLIDLGWFAGCPGAGSGRVAQHRGTAARAGIGACSSARATVAAVPAPSARVLRRIGQNPARNQFNSLRRRGTRTCHRGISAPVRRVG